MIFQLHQFAQVIALTMYIHSGAIFVREVLWLFLSPVVCDEKIKPQKLSFKIIWLTLTVPNQLTLSMIDIPYFSACRTWRQLFEGGVYLAVNLDHKMCGASI